MTEAKEPAEVVIEGAWDNYNKIIDSVAEKVFKEEILPWLHKKGYNFLAGNGTWYVFKGDESIFEEDIPDKILKFLQMEVPGMDANDLGSLMPDYPEGTDQ